jgi:hypothetical protein
MAAWTSSSAARHTTSNGMRTWGGTGIESYKGEAIL